MQEDARRLSQLAEGEKQSLEKRKHNLQSGYVRDPLILRSITNQEEYLQLRTMCFKELLNDKHFELAIRLAKMSELLILPENMIQISSAQYTNRAVNERTYRDMTDETVQELVRLPRFSAYAKVIEERRGVQAVSKQKIQTFPLAPKRLSDDVPIEYTALEDCHHFCMEREQIEKEIRERQEKWRQIESERKSKPPQGSPPEAPPRPPRPPTRF